MVDARAVYMNAVKLYEDTFGAESLQGTPFLFDPVHPTDDDFLKAARIYIYGKAQVAVYPISRL